MWSVFFRLSSHGFVIKPKYSCFRSCLYVGAFFFFRETCVLYCLYIFRESSSVRPHTSPPVAPVALSLVISEACTEQFFRVKSKRGITSIFCWPRTVAVYFRVITHKDHHYPCHYLPHFVLRRRSVCLTKICPTKAYLNIYDLI